MAVWDLPDDPEYPVLSFLKGIRAMKTQYGGWEGRGTKQQQQQKNKATTQIPTNTALDPTDVLRPSEKIYFEICSALIIQVEN